MAIKASELNTVAVELHGISKRFGQPAAHYALVVIDLSLRGIPGEQLSRMMLDANPEVRLIVTSGYPFQYSELEKALVAILKA